MLNRCRITNITSLGVVIEDIGVYLPGKGDSSIVNADIIEKSKDFKHVENLVRIDKIDRIEELMPVWPFHKSTSSEEKEKISEEELKDIRQDIIVIRKLLIELLSRSFAPTPEMIAAHFQIAQMRQELLKSGKSSLSVEEPIFIPTSIIPNNAEVAIKMKEAEIVKDDFDKNLRALKKLLKK